MFLVFIVALMRWFTVGLQIGAPWDLFISIWIKFLMKCMFLHILVTMQGVSPPSWKIWKCYRQRNPFHHICCDGPLSLLHFRQDWFTSKSWIQQMSVMVGIRLDVNIVDHDWINFATLTSSKFHFMFHVSYVTFTWDVQN